MQTPFVTLSPEELLSISPELRNKYREAITPRRISPESAATLQNAAEEESHVEEIPEESEGQQEHIVVPDPFEAYLRTVSTDEAYPELVVADTSHALRAIMVLIDNKREVECILDPGCQVIAMSEEICHSLGLQYDPTVRMRMISANGSKDATLGLARNVPCQIGDITLYLQIHVIREASYDVLLGRPFDVLTGSLVQNFQNENQTITIFCPNTDRRVTVPTHPRGHPHFRRPMASGTSKI